MDPAPGAEAGLREGRSGYARLVLARPLRAALRRLARRSYPREACGVLLGRRSSAERRVEALVPGRNLHADPCSAFELHPATVIVAARMARLRGLELIGFFHSHPDGTPWPSGADRQAAWEDMLSLIVAVDACGRTCMGGHLWREGRVVRLFFSAGRVPRASGR